MELREKVELAIWSMRRTIERSRYIHIATEQLAARIRRSAATPPGPAAPAVPAVNPDGQELPELLPRGPKA